MEIMTTSKWDIVDDVVAYDPFVADAKSIRTRAKIAKLATTALFGAVVCAGSVALASSSPFSLHVSSYGVSESVKLLEKCSFVRPRGERVTDFAASADDSSALIEVDTQVGMSTRRLAELHKKLFIPDESVQEELTGEYAFL